MTASGRRYHHGEVPSAVRAAALALVEAEGAQAVTMRALAAEVGVDHRALYRHFADRDAVLADVAAEGYRRLLAALQDGAGGSTPLHADFAAYIGFALVHPYLHALMLTRARADMDAHTPLSDAVQAVLAHLMGSARAALGAQDHARDRDAKDLAFAGLAAAYGMVSLAASRTLMDRPPEAVRAFVTDQVHGVLTGQLLRFAEP